MFDDGKFHVIPAVRSLKFFAEALRTEEEWILTSNCAHIGNLQSLSHKCHDANKKIIVNHEIVGGLGADKTAFAMSTLSLIPVFLIFLFFNRYLVEGISTSGIKG